MDNRNKNLDDFFKQKKEEKKHDKEILERKKAKVENFFKSIVIPAFKELKANLEEKYEREVDIREYLTLERASIHLYLKKEEASQDESEEYASKYEREEFTYSLQVDISSDTISVHPEIVSKNKEIVWLKGLKPSAAPPAVMISDISKVTKELIIDNFLECYTTYGDKA